MGGGTQTKSGGDGGGDGVCVCVCVGGGGGWAIFRFKGEGGLVKRGSVLSQSFWKTGCMYAMTLPNQLTLKQI